MRPLHRDMRIHFPYLAILIVLAGCGQSAPAADKKNEGGSQTGVILTPEQIKSLGIATTPARITTYRRTVSGYGVVVALDTIAQADADIASAAAVAQQSAAAAARARSLSTGDEAAVSQEVVEAAQSKAEADQAALALARHKFQSVFGLGAPWKTPADRKAVMAKLAAGRAVLVRVTFPLGSLGGAKPREIAVARLGNARRLWTSHTVWEAPADPNLPGTGFYCLVEGSDLAQNEHLTAGVQVGQQSAGVWVPQTAILVSEDDTWVYVEPESGHFLRVRIDIDRPEKDGFFLGPDAGITPNEKIVTGAAGLLLAHEINPGTDDED